MVIIIYEEGGEKKEGWKRKEQKSRINYYYYYNIGVACFAGYFIRPNMGNTICKPNKSKEPV